MVCSRTWFSTIPLCNTATCLEVQKLPPKKPSAPCVCPARAPGSRIPSRGWRFGQRSVLFLNATCTSHCHGHWHNTHAHPGGHHCPCPLLTLHCLPRLSQSHDARPLPWHQLQPPKNSAIHHDRHNNLQLAHAQTCTTSFRFAYSSRSLVTVCNNLAAALFRFCSSAESSGWKTICETLVALDPVQSQHRTKLKSKIVPKGQHSMTLNNRQEDCQYLTTCKACSLLLGTSFSIQTHLATQAHHDNHKRQQHLPRNATPPHHREPQV